MVRFLWICFGGAVGTGARFLLSGFAPTVLGTAFPYGTLLVNAIGSFLISILMYLGLEAGLLSPLWRMALTTGVMGGFTTYSTFNFETLGYFRQGAFFLGCLNILVTVVACMVAGILGLLLCRWLWPR